MTNQKAIAITNKILNIYKDLFMVVEAQQPYKKINT